MKKKTFTQENGQISVIFKKIVLKGNERFLYCSSSLFMRLWFHMWRLFCNYLFLNSSSFGSSRWGWGGGVLCFLFVAFPRYLYLFLVCYFCYINGFLASFVRIRTRCLLHTKTRLLLLCLSPLITVFTLSIGTD